MRLNVGDLNKVKSIMFNPGIVNIMSDDPGTNYIQKVAGPHFQDNTTKKLLRDPGYYFLMPSEGILFMVMMRTFTLFEVHTMILPKYRGIEAVEHTRRAAKWMFDNTQCEKIYTYVPFYNRPARLFARKVGMLDQGILTKSIRKDGELHDQWILGLEKEALCPLSE